MFTDIVGYSALMTKDEKVTLLILAKNRELQKKALKRFNGEFIKEIGDGTLSIFQSSWDAVRCAIELQNTLNETASFQLRIGIHIGDIVISEKDVFGDGVNIASRIQALCEPGGILISETVCNEIRNKNGIKTDCLGERPLKNIDKPVIVYAIDSRCFNTIAEQLKSDEKIQPFDTEKGMVKPKRKLIFFLSGLLGIMAIVVVLSVFNLISGKKGYRDLEKSIAVLPFVNDSPNAENTYFINGIMDEVLINLMAITDLRGPGRTTVEQYRNPTKSIPEIAKELGVNYIVEGSGQRYGNTFCLRIQLLEGVADRHLWGESYEQIIESTEDIIRIQSQIAQAIAKELKAVITPQEKDRIEKIPTKELEAYDAYLKGRFYYNKLSRYNFDTAMQYFELAKEKDPEFALAYAGIGRVWRGREQMGIVSPSEATPKAEAAVKRALDLDSTYSDVYHLLGGIRTWSRWDWKGGEAALRKAIELDPRNADAHSTYSHLLNILGRPDEALKHIAIALEFDPLNSKILAFYGQDLMFVHRYDDAVKAFKKALDLSPLQGVAVNIISALYFAGRKAEATEMLRKFYNDIESLHAIDEGYNMGGFQGAMKKLSDVRAERAKITSIGFYGVAHGYALAGDSNNALHWMEKAYMEHDPNLPYLLLPAFDLVREDPRFQEIARKIHLPYK